MPTNLMSDQTAKEVLPARHRFDFMRDSFAFPNELVWEYRLDRVTGERIFGPRIPKPEYAHRCFALARVARQFFYHARFVADQPVATDEIYQQRIRAIMARNPRVPCKPEDQIVIAGFAGLRQFSEACEKLLKTE